MMYFNQADGKLAKGHSNRPHCSGTTYDFKEKMTPGELVLKSLAFNMPRLWLKPDRFLRPGPPCSTKQTSYNIFSTKTQVNPGRYYRKSPAQCFIKARLMIVIPAKAGIQNYRRSGFRIKCGMTATQITLDRALFGKSGIMKRAFSLVELMIVVAILGILAAIALPTFQGHVSEARQAAAKENLHILRNAIEFYATQHNGVPPGYPDNDPSNEPYTLFFIVQLVNSGKYISKLPANPFNGIRGVKTIGNNEDFPTGHVLLDLYGWIYKPATKTIKLNWEGTDKDGIAYLDY